MCFRDDLPGHGYHAVRVGGVWQEARSFGAVARSPHLAADADGVVHAAWIETGPCPEACEALNHALADKGGLSSITRLSNPTPTHLATPLVVATDDRIAIARGGAEELDLVEATDGETFGTACRVATISSPWPDFVSRPLAAQLGPAGSGRFVYTVPDPGDDFNALVMQARIEGR